MDTKFFIKQNNPFKYMGVHKLEVRITRAAKAFFADVLFANIVTVTEELWRNRSVPV